MTSIDGGGRPWDIDQYRPGVKRTVRAPKSDVPGQVWDEAAGDGRRIRVQYEPDGAPLIVIAGMGAILSVLTLGIYRFWMVTRLRRYYWRAVNLEGDPLEYTGRGMEKLIGFLIAILFLAIWLGIANLALTYVGFVFGSEQALQLGLLAAVPFYFFAVYRGRRYVMARTRWRGIRFGMEGGAWGFTLRAMLWGLLTVLTAGFLYPLMHFKMEKYMADRTWFGDLKVEQGGSWLGLLGPWTWIYVIGAFIGLASWASVEAPGDLMSLVIAGVILTFGTTMMMIAFLAYHVSAFRYLWENRSVGTTKFANDISTGGVLGIYIGGYFMVSLCTTLVAALVIMGGLAVLFALAPETAGIVSDIIEGDYGALAGMASAETVGLLIGVGGYLFTMAAAFVFGHIFIVSRVLRRKAESMTVINPGNLSRSQQREHDEAAEAGGFADALGVDIGAGF